MKVAIVHDWLINGGGAERHIYGVCRLFPKAPIYTSVYYPESSLAGFKELDVRPTFINKTPFFRRHHQWAVGLRYLAWRRLNLSQYDLIISSSGSEAKAVRTSPGQLHVNICYSPTHYYWSHYEQYLSEPGFGWLDSLVRIGLRIGIKPLRKLDLWASRQPDLMVANSTSVAERIERYYQRQSEVIFPPVKYPKESHRSSPRSGYVIVGRHVEYKNFTLAIEACNKLKRQLVVIGEGPQTAKLKSIAGPTIKFTGLVSEEEKFRYLASARGFIFPNEDDFGIAPVEAMAMGTPVIALAAGGALDTVIDGSTGIFFKDPTSASLQKALKQFEEHSFSAEKCRTRAEKFSETVFKKTFKQYLDNAWREFNGR